jgi:hypothetical protein
VTTATPASIRTASPGPLPPLRFPRKPTRASSFERLFGEGGNAAARRAALRNRASLLDAFTAEIARLKRRSPRHRTASASISISTAAVGGKRNRTRRTRRQGQSNTPDLERPVGVPAAFADHAKLMFDLQILAFQADITRVIAFQFTREQSNRTYPEIGVRDPHHPHDHHGNDPYKVAQIAKINTYHVKLFSEFLQRLKPPRTATARCSTTPSTLYGSGMGNPSLHDHENLPILVAGGAASRLKGGRHLRYAKRPTSPIST